MRVRVYWNLHKDCYSLLNWEPRDPNKGRLLKDFPHRNSVELHDVKFVVQPGGRARVLREKRKNVHAYLEGELVYEDFSISPGYLPVWYNPYRSNKFQGPNAKASRSRRACFSAPSPEGGRVIAWEHASRVVCMRRMEQGHPVARMMAAK